MNRLLPQSLENEKQILGCMIIDSESTSRCDVFSTLRPEHFLDADHAMIYTAMVDMWDKNLTIELPSLRDELNRRGQLSQVGGIDTLIAVCESIGGMTNSDYYAKVIYEKYQRRQIISITGAMQHEAYDEGLDLQDVLRRVDRIAEVACGNVQVMDDLSGCVDQVIKDLHAVNRPEVAIGTGLVELNEITDGGFRPGELIVLGARPGMGKSALALNIAGHVAIDRKLPVQLISLEMKKTEIVHRMLASRSRMPLWKIRHQNRLSDTVLEQLDYPAQCIRESPLYVNDRYITNINVVKNMAKLAKHKYGIRLLVVDYLQLIGGSEPTGYERVSRISRELKILASDLEIPVIVLSQLSRAVELRPGKRPMMSDLRESGTIEQDADIVMMLYREDYYRRDEPGYECNNLAECSFAKNRSGSTESCLLSWHGDIVSFDEKDIPL